jgi:hypothetical protein
MFIGNLFIRDKSVYFRTLAGEEFEFRWKDEILSPTSDWVRMMLTEYGPMCCKGIRVGDVLLAHRWNRMGD